MRNALVLLSSLALAAAASAQMASTATSSVIATYETNGDASFASVTGYEYDFGSDNNYSGDDTNAGILGADHATTHAHAAGSNLFAMTSTSTVAQGSTDYAAYGDAYQQTFVGYTYNLKFDGGATGGTVSFKVTTIQSVLGSADSPIGQLEFGAVPGTFVPGAYVEGLGHAGVAETTGDPLGQAPVANQRNLLVRSAYPETPLVATSTINGTLTETFTVSFDLLAGEHRSFRVYASTSAYSEYYNPAPVPEPASLAALGVGALTLLRRRKQA